MRKIVSSLAVIVLVHMLCAGASAQVRLPGSSLCLTFGQSTDLFEGEAMPRRSPGGYFTLSMVERTFNRAAYGGPVLNNGIYRIGFSKNTNTATISYQCDIPADSLVGQCNLIVFSAITSTSTLLTDVGTLAFGRCAISGSSEAAGLTNDPLGEWSN